MVRAGRPGGVAGGARSATAVLAVLTLVAGCTGSSGRAEVDDGVSQARITVTPGAHERVAAGAEVTVVTSQGHLQEVAVVTRKGDHRAPGTLSADGRTWTTDPDQLLAFGARYVVTATAVDDRGRPSSVRSTFRVRETTEMRALLSPARNRVVGVGMPVVARLSARPADRAQVESLMTVRTSEPVTGSWHWFSDTELHWRPRTYWPSGTRVTVRAALDGVRFGKDVYGAHTTVARFRVGDAMVSTVDVAGHTMTVRRNGRVLRTIPVTTGNDQYPTRGGTKVIATHERRRVMDSSTVDIPAGSPDAYRIEVEYAMRLTWSGEFVHAAPWSVGSQGRANVSHGCTGMSTDQARWLFERSRVGDVVEYVNAERGLEQGNGYTDWNLSWKQWLAGSALASPTSSGRGAAAPAVAPTAAPGAPSGSPTARPTGLPSSPVGAATAAHAA